MKSVITEAKLTKRYSTGDYEFEEFTLSAAVDENESGAVVLSEMKKQINEAFTGEVSSKQTKGPKAKKEEKKDGKAKSNPSDDEDNNDEDSSEENEGNDGESNHDDEAADSEDRDDSDDSAEESEDEAGGEDEEKPAKGSKGAGKKSDGEKSGGKKFKKKPQSYTRDIEQHKEIFSGIVRSIDPEWKKNDNTKAKVKKISVGMEGEAFLDEHGEVLDSFKAEVKKRMKGK